MTARIAVVGSFNVDLVARARRLPGRGETVIGHDFGTFTGGKGGNQGIAAARLGAHVSLIGRLGRDGYGDDLFALLTNEGIDTAGVHRDEHAGTGVAVILVGDDGDNSLIVVPRANANLSPADIAEHREAIIAADVLLLQLETPLEATMRAAELARAAGVTVVLNPAPARALPDELLALVDVLTPNETEAASLTGQGLLGEPAFAAHGLRQRGVKTVIITLGARGAFIATNDFEAVVEPFVVQAVDSTAAGDAFCGALAVALAEGKALPAAVRFANAAGALACTQVGAGPSLPRRAAVDRFVGE